MRAALHNDVIYVQKLTPLPFFRRVVQNPRASKSDCATSFSVMTYNVLADNLCSPAVYDYANPLSLNWSERRDRMMREIVQYDPGVVGLQEIQATVLHWGKATFKDNHAGWFREQLAKLGYDGCLRVNEHDARLGIKSNKWPRIGVALFWKTALWEPLPNGVRRINYSSCMIKACAGDKAATRALSLWQGAVLSFMRHLPTGNLAVFATTHISCRWQEPFVQIMQMHSLVREIESTLGSELAATIPVIIFGDFNVSPTSGGYELYTKGKLAADHAQLRAASHPTEAGKKPIRLPYPAPKQTIPLRSAYASVLGAEPAFTNFALREMSIFSAALDYIFYTPTSVKPCAVLDTIPESIAAEETALPSRRCPSDHLPLYAEFSFIAKNSQLEKVLVSALGPASAHGEGLAIENA
jgi:CCR4-NOT transcription complex subunit 6